MALLRTADPAVRRTDAVVLLILALLAALSVLGAKLGAGVRESLPPCPAAGDPVAHELFCADQGPR